MAPTLRSRDRQRAQKRMQSLPARILPEKKRKPTPQRTKKKRASTAEKSLRSQNRNIRRSRLLSLPAEVRLRIYYYATSCPSGPEVFVGVGSHESARSTIPSGRPHTFRGLDWGGLSWFHSKVTGNSEVVRNTCTQRDFSSGSTLQFASSGSPYGLPVRIWKPRPVTEDVERHWPMAVQCYLRPLMACKTLYYEAAEEFFKSRHFVLGSSTYALAWLRKIGKQNAMNIRSVRFKIHRETYVVTGVHSLNGLYWDEVLNRLRRLAPELLVLGLHYEEGIYNLADAQSLCRRVPGFQNLRRVDLYTWGQCNSSPWTPYPPWNQSTPGSVPRSVSAFMESFFRQNRILIRVLEVCSHKPTDIRHRQMFPGQREFYYVLAKVYGGQDGEPNLGESCWPIEASEACLP